MIHVTTTSGAEYLIDGLRVQRLSGPHSPLIDYDQTPDGVWEILMAEPVIKVGRPLFMTKEGGKLRISTPVVAVEEK